MSIPSQAVASARSLLFVPGDRPDRFAKAADSGADLIIIDLEDAVASDRKTEARSSTGDWLAAGRRAVIRINPPGTPWFADDLEMAARYGGPVMLPKAEDPTGLQAVTERMGGGPLIPLIETALGMERAFDICATAGVVRVAFGNVDYAAQIGVAPEDHLALAYARSRLTTACAAAGLCPPIDGVTTRLKNDAVLDEDVVHARRLGFAGKLCIHPSQVSGVHHGFSPSADELAWAREVVAADGSVSAVNGQLVDRPVVERARRILSSAGPEDH